jgi:hypothetical protein
MKLLRLLLLSMLALGTTVSAQTKTPTEKPASDFLMIQLGIDGWAGKPDSIHTTGIGKGLNVYLCKNYPLKNSKLSFAAGIGIGSSSIYLDNQEARFADTTFVKFEAETKNYSKYKLTTAYFEAPLELRYFDNNVNKNKGFKAAIGLRIGTLLQAHTKGVYSFSGVKTTDKVVSKHFLDTWRFAATARVGYGNFSLFVAYNLNTLFKAGSGPDITPYSVGLCISGL